MQKIKSFLADSWLVIFVAMQPVLDVAAYFTASSAGTVAGYIRLAFMLVLPLYLLVKMKDKKCFLISMCVIAAFCLLHFVNCLRNGYISASYDVAYMARVAQMPILTVCFMCFMRDGQTREQAKRGLLIAAMLYILLLAAAVVTGSANSTYGDGIGVSGWVLDDNRTANSLILVTLCCFCMYVAAGTEKKTAQILIPVMVFLLLLSNGTKSCYVSAFALFIGYAIFLTLEKLVCGRGAKITLIVVLLALFAATFAVYPYTPRAKVDALQASSSDKLQREFDAELAATGRDVSMLTAQEVADDAQLNKVFEKYYRALLYYKIPDLFDRFELAQIYEKYDLTTSVAKLDKTRVEKIVYASLIFDESDLLTKLVGIEVSDIALGTKYDLENDWPALFYYYGYLGCALYAAFVLWFLYLVVKRLFADFKGSLTVLNFTLLVALALQIGLAQYSGALLRRPNVSIYMSVVLSLIYCQTALAPLTRKGRSADEA